MALKMILNKQTDFTGEFPAEYAASGLWRFNESAPDEDTALAETLPSSIGVVQRQT